MRASRALGEWLVGALLLALATGAAESHEGVHQRPRAGGRIDPGRAYPFMVLSGAGGHFHSLLPSPDLKTLFAGTHLGLFRSEDRGLTWRLAAARLSGEEVHGVAADPRSGILYVATHGQGLLRSLDGGARWTRHHQGLPGRDLHALALDPQRPERLYVWVVGHGLFRSEDRGSHWSRLAGPETLAGPESLVIPPRDGQHLYAGTARGVWVSDDGGRHWRLPEKGLPHRVAGLSIPPWRPDRIFAATLEGSFIGTADGAGWTPIPPPPAWWGPLTSYTFLSEHPDIAIAVTHEGVTAIRDLTVGEWVPLAEWRMPSDRTR